MSIALRGPDNRCKFRAFDSDFNTHVKKISEANEKNALEKNHYNDNDNDTSVPKKKNDSTEISEQKKIRNFSSTTHHHSFCHSTLIVSTSILK